MIAIPYLAVVALTTSLFGSCTAAPSFAVDHVDEYVRRDAAAPPFIKRAASCNFPYSPRTVNLNEPVDVSGIFDGGNVRYQRGPSSCNRLGVQSDSVFVIQPGGTLQNVVIGANQVAGVYCLGSCNLYNVWFEGVCRDAININQSSGQSNIIGGGTTGASHNIVQHNGGGTVKIDSYCVQNFGKLYRSCGNCSPQYKREALISQIIGTQGSVLAAVNSNYGDTACLDTESLWLSSVDSICDTWEGNSNGGNVTKTTINVRNENCRF